MGIALTIKSSMLSAIHASCLIFALLICPFRCMGAFASDCAAVSAHQCSCCHHAQQGDGDQDVPADHSDDCGCENCLCHGAVRGDDASSLLIDTAIVFSPAVICPDDLSTLLEPSALIQRPESPPAAVSGMSLRIAQQSFLC
jgi:hypothetical protein